MQSGKMFVILIVAVEGLISVEPGVVTMGPDESDATENLPVPTYLVANSQ
jgi:hypothetical protein